MAFTALAPAKVNLFLHVGPRQDDRYHPIASLMAFADVGDRLSLAADAAIGLTVEGPFARGLAGHDNLVMRAAELMLARAGGPCAPVRLVLEKALPIAAGLGGGSSDAAAALKLLRDAWRPGMTDEALVVLAAELGSDVPACVVAGSVIAEGRGERLTRGPGLPELNAVLVNPGAASPTGQVYAAFDAGQAPGADLPPLPVAFESAEETAAFLSLCRNDLEPAALTVCSPIGEVLETLRGEPETLLARLSGSGATAFALCASDIEAEGLAERIEAMRPAWWVKRCRLS